MNNTTGKTIDLTAFFKQLDLNVGSYSIVETPAMYPHKRKAEDNWSFYSASAFKLLQPALAQEQKPAGNFAIVGIGSGVEGVAALEIFRQFLANLVVTDIDEQVAQGAVHNLAAKAAGFGVNLIPLCGSFAEPLQALPFTLDVVYGNIPNLPATGGQRLEFGAEKGTFVSPEYYDRYYPPKKYLKWALGAQYAYVQSAQRMLATHGSVLTELGGRVPLALVRELFADCGLKAAEVAVGFKEQTEALIDFEGYHAFERAYGVEFDFYLYRESAELMCHLGVRNPGAAVSGDSLKRLLAPFRVNAGQALELFKRGVAVGHTVHVLRGTR